jgi:predicted RNase H-like nuclease (RuvC/YqgF family)
LVTLFKNLTTSRKRLLSEVERLRLENERLRESGETLQRAKKAAVTHSDDLRSRVERLQAKIASLTQELRDEKRIGAQLREKLEAAREEIDILSKKHEAAVRRTKRQ